MRDEVYDLFANLDEGRPGEPNLLQTGTGGGRNNRYYDSL
jgi:hypothetical protein